MKGSMVPHGLNEVRSMLRSIGQKVPDGARGFMRRASNRIVARAKIYVPEDEGNLMRSIRVEKTYGTRGRLQIDIVAGGQTVTNYRGRIIDLDQYAAIVHEAYEEMLVYGPGERTEEKMARYPGLVGSGFLTRAAEHEAEGLERFLADEITEIIKKEQRK